MKWGIEKKVIILNAIFIGTLSGVIVNAVSGLLDVVFYQLILLEIFFIGTISMALLLFRFYRDPEREIPEIESAILSPADGRILYVKKTEDGEIPFSEKNGRKFRLTDFFMSDLLSMRGTLVGIQMNFLDVHVNRAPLDGRVTLLKHINGLFVSLGKKEAIIQNERVFTVIDSGYIKVGIVQIASRLVRKIVPYIREGSEVKRGQRIGMIRFGSQVDLYLPDVPSFRIEVRPGEKVKAGVSVIATLTKGGNFSEI